MNIPQVKVTKTPSVLDLPAENVQQKEIKIVNKNNNDNFNLILGIVVFTAIILGVITGFIVSNKKVVVAPEKQIEVKNIADTAIGILEEGGVNEKGTHRIGEIALTSAVLDLDSFIGKNVAIEGVATGTENVDWLIDVAKVKVQ